MTRSLGYCIVNKFGIVGSWNPDGGFSPMLLRFLNPAIRAARKLANVSKIEHAVAIYDGGTGAVIKAASVEARALRKPNTDSRKQERKRKE